MHQRAYFPPTHIINLQLITDGLALLTEYRIVVSGLNGFGKFCSREKCAGSFAGRLARALSAEMRRSAVLRAAGRCSTANS